MLSQVRTLYLHFTKLLTRTIELDTLSEESYKDSTLIMQLLRDNLVGLLTSYCLSHSLTDIRLYGHHLRPSQAVAKAVPRQQRAKRPATQPLQLHPLSQKRLRSRCSSHHTSSRLYSREARKVEGWQSNPLWLDRILDSFFLGPVASSILALTCPFSTCSRSTRTMVRRLCEYSFGGHCDMRCCGLILQA